MMRHLGHGVAPKLLLKCAVFLLLSTPVLMLARADPVIDDSLSGQDILVTPGALHTFDFDGIFSDADGNPFSAEFTLDGAIQTTFNSASNTLTVAFPLDFTADDAPASVVLIGGADGMTRSPSVDFTISTPPINAPSSAVWTKLEILRNRLAQLQTFENDVGGSTKITHVSMAYNHSGPRFSGDYRISSYDTAQGAARASDSSVTLEQASSTSDGEQIQFIAGAVDLRLLATSTTNPHDTQCKYPDPTSVCRITLTYDDTFLGIPEAELSIFHFDVMERAWEQLPIESRDMASNTITVTTDSLSPFAIGRIFIPIVASVETTASLLNKEIMSRFTQALVANTVSSIENRVDATFSTSRTANYQFDGQTVQLDGQIRLSTKLRDTLQRKLPNYMISLKDDSMDWKQMMGNSSFVLPLNATDSSDVEDVGLTVWGSGDYTKLSGKSAQEGLDWKGDIYSLQLGVDQRVHDDLLVGGLLSVSKGDVDYTVDDDKGDYKHSITSVHPYLAWTNGNGDVNLWGSAGFGKGKLEISKTSSTTRAKTRLLSLSAGAKGELTQIRGMSIKSDVSLANTKIRDLIDDDGNISDPGETIISQRLRVILEFERERALASGTLKPTVEIGARYDGGDGDKGAGAVLGAGVHYANTTGLLVEGKVHALVGKKDYKE